MIWPITHSANATTSSRPPSAAANRNPRRTKAPTSAPSGGGAAGLAQGSREVRSVAVMTMVYPFRIGSVEQHGAQVEPAEHTISRLGVDTWLAPGRQHLRAGGGERLGLGQRRDFAVPAHLLELLVVLGGSRFAA